MVFNSFTACWMDYSKQHLSCSQAHTENKRENQVCVWSIRTSALASSISLYNSRLRCFQMRASGLFLSYRYRWLCSRSWARMLYDMTVKRRWYGESLTWFTAFAKIRAYKQYKFLYQQIKTHQTDNMPHTHFSKHLSNLWIMSCCRYGPNF